MRFSILPFILLIVPIMEIGVFILVGGEIGVLWTFALILFTAVLGSILLRIQGFQIISRLRTEINAQRLPGRELVHGAMILVAGVLLLTPGFVTDTLGFLLFVPQIRGAIWSAIASRVNFATVSAEGYRRYRDKRDGVVDLDPEEFSETGPREGKSPWHETTEPPKLGENDPPRNRK